MEVLTPGTMIAGMPKVSVLWVHFAGSLRYPQGLCSYAALTRQTS